tara:strand:+ start:34381 stop:35490 length:1110 start_codon:yes stop_codon:yes gene_type:complete
MSDNIIFIHIPKTGGTTINTAMQGNYWQTAPDFNYRHIVFKQKRSNSGDIFHSENTSMFDGYKLFMMLRHPVDKMISEYYFLHDRAEFMDMLHPKPKSFEEYVEHAQTPDYTLGFLIGDKIYDKKRPTKEDLNRVIDAIEKLPIHTGIFEHFGDSLEYFSKETGIEWSKNIEAKRVTFKRPKMDDLSPELYQRILDTNALDFELYNYCLNKFNDIRKTLPKSKISFDIDKYNHVIPYVSLTCLFEYFMDNKHFIQQNFLFFKNLTFFLLKQKGVKDGKKFTQIWNQVFVDSVKNQFPDSHFSNAISTAYSLDKDPLDVTGDIAKSLDAFFSNNPKGTKKFYKPMVFNPMIIIEPRIEKKKGFLGKLFAK